MTALRQNMPILTSLAGLGQRKPSPAFQTLGFPAFLAIEKNCPASPGTHGPNWDSTSNTACCDRLEEIVALKYFMCVGRKGQMQPCPVL